MKSVALLLSTLLLVPLAHSSEAEPRDALEVSIWSFDVSSAFLSWTPAPGAIGYLIFRGDTPETATLIGQSATTTFYDATAPVEQAWYVILSVQSENGAFDIVSPSRGACIKHKGATGLSVTTAHCIPTRPL